MADPYKGEQTQILVGTEDTQGTAVTPTRLLGKITEEATPPDPEQEWMVQHVIGSGAGREPTQKHQGHRTFEGGDIPIVVYDGAAVAYVLGTDSFDDAPDPSEHTITPKVDGKPPTQTIEVAYTGRGGGSDFVRTFTGCAPNSAELSMNNDDELTLSPEYWAMDVTTGGSPTSVTMPDKDPWLFADASSQLTLFGTPFARFNDFSLTFENSLQAGRYIVDDATHPVGDTRNPYELLYGNVGYELSATITVSDDSLYQELLSPTAGGFTGTIPFEKPNGELFQITARGLNFTDADHPAPAESEPIEVEVTMEPSYDLESDQTGLEILISDTTATAAYV